MFKQKAEPLALAHPGSSKRERRIAFAVMASLGIFVLMMILNPAFAATDYTSTIIEIVDQIVDIVCLIFQVIGVILGIYAVGQLVLAFKNEDANSKAEASRQLVVAVILIAVPGIITGLNLVNYIGDFM